MEWANAAVNLGVGGFSILVMWWMYESSAKRIDALNKEIRDEIMGQLTKNTAAYERVIDHITKK
jgi:hypothetical protein